MWTRSLLLLLAAAVSAMGAEWALPSDRAPATGTWAAAGIPGGIPVRETIADTITTTGADQTSEINTALAAAGTGEVVYLPDATYRIDGTITVPSNKTLRGAVSGANNLPATRLDCRGGTGLRLGSQYEFNWPTGGANLVVASLTKGATTIQVDDASQFSAGHLALVRIGLDPTFPLINVYGGDRGRGQAVKIASVNTAASPDTITIEAPGLHGDYTTAEDATIIGSQGLFNVSAGVENIIVDGDNSGNTMQTGIAMDSSWKCWVLNCLVEHAENYGIAVGQGYGGNYQCEVRRSRSTGENTIATSHGGFFVGNGTTSCLFIDNIIDNWIFALLQQVMTSANVFAYNLWLNVNSNTTNVIVNHDPCPQYTLFEGNVGSYTQTDGYYGGSIYDMQFRNWWMGKDLSVSEWWFSIIANRYVRYYSAIGNVLGRTGIGSGLSFGNPNINNGDSTVAASRRAAPSTLTTRTNATSGTITAPASHGITTASTIDLIWMEVVSTFNVAKVRRGVTVGTVSGTSIPFSGGEGDDLPAAAAEIFVPTSNSALWRNSVDWDEAEGREKRWTGEMTTINSGTSGVITLDTGQGTDFETAWDSAFTGQRGMRPVPGFPSNANISSMIVTDVTGDVVTYTTSSWPSQPDVGEAVTLVPSNFGLQELDLDVLYTALLKANYHAEVSGSGIPTVESIGADTLPDSLFLTVEPDFFTDASCAWPPVDPTSPTEAYEIIPAGKRFVAGLATPLEERTDAIAVFDMQTMDGDDIANLVAGSSEYDLVLDAINTTPAHLEADFPVVDSEGLVFPATDGLSRTAVAAGTGTVETGPMTVYVAFKRTGTSVGGSFGQTTLLDSTLAIVRTLDPEEAPVIHTPDVDSNYVIGRWNDGVPHLMTAVVQAASVDMYLDGALVLHKVAATTVPIELDKFNISELTKGFVGTVYYAAVFDGAHDAETRATIFGQIQDELDTRGVTIAPPVSYVVVEGDSITQTNYIVSALLQYHRQLTTLTPIPPAVNFAVSGDQVEDAEARASLTDTLWSTDRTYNVLSAYIGANDLPSGSAASAFAAYKTYCEDRKAAAALVGVDLKIIAATAVVRDLIEGFEEKRLAFNTMIREDDSFYDALADFGGNEHLGDPDEAPLSNYFYDGVHPNIAGHAIMAPIWLAAYEAAIAAPEETPATPTYRRASSIISRRR